MHPRHSARTPGPRANHDHVAAVLLGALPDGHRETSGDTGASFRQQGIEPWGDENAWSIRTSLGGGTDHSRDPQASQADASSSGRGRFPFPPRKLRRQLGGRYRIRNHFGRQGTGRTDRDLAEGGVASWVERWVTPRFRRVPPTFAPGSRSRARRPPETVPAWPRPTGSPGARRSFAIPHHSGCCGGDRQTPG